MQVLIPFMDIYIEVEDSMSNVWTVPPFKYKYGLSIYLHSPKRVTRIMDFSGNLLTRCGKTFLRAFLSWITGMALSMK